MGLILSTIQDLQFCGSKATVKKFLLVVNRHDETEVSWWEYDTYEELNKAALWWNSFYKQNGEPCYSVHTFQQLTWEAQP